MPVHEKVFPPPRGANSRRDIRKIYQLNAQDKIVELITQNINFFQTLESLLPGTPLPEDNFLLDGNLNRWVNTGDEGTIGVVGTITDDGGIGIGINIGKDL